MRSCLRKQWDDLYEWVENSYRGYKYRKKARLRLKQMGGGNNCKKEYDEIIIPYWKKYGQKPNIIWYKLFSAENKCVDPRYIPDDMWFKKILPYFSNTQFRRAGEDKCMHGIWFHDIKRPYTVSANIAGVFYDNDYNVISKNEAIKRCVEYKKFIIKPSIDSGEARLIQFYDNEKITVEKVEEAFCEYGANYIVQEIIDQHPEMAKLNASSLNTIRVVSLFFKEEVYILSSILRVGGCGSRVDNIGAGGFACSITSDGKLNKVAVNRKSEWVECNQNGIRFDSIVVPNYHKVEDLIKIMHKRLAHFKIIGWDIGISSDGEPILIEFNSNPGQNQYSCGPTFGELTEEVLSDVFITKSLEKSRN